MTINIVMLGPLNNTLLVYSHKYQIFTTSDSSWIVWFRFGWSSL